MDGPDGWERTPGIDERTGVRIYVCACVFLLCAVTRTCIVNSLELAFPLTDLDETGSKISDLVTFFKSKKVL